MSKLSKEKIEQIRKDAEVIPEEDKCSRCNTNKANPSHTCPYRLEINDSEDECDCCDDCTHECIMDI